MLRSAAVVLAAALPPSAASASGGPPPALVQAFARTQAAASASLTLTERISAGGQTVTLRLRGVEQPKARSGSFVFSLSPGQAGLGQASEIVRGPKVYVHFAVLDTLHAKNPAVKSWVVVDARSSLGFDPEALTLLGTKELDELTGVAVAGRGTEQGVPVTRYRGTLDLRRAAKTPQLQQLLARLPSSAAAGLRGKESIVISVGQDGYVHRLTSSLEVPAGGARLRIEIDATLGGFGGSVGAIVPPPASEVMTLARFDRLLGLPAPGDTALLSRVVLGASQVGPGYRLSQIPGGQRVQGERTLDFCGHAYPSESLRTARLQVAYARPHDRFKASNEVVTYRAGGARQALREVGRAARTCPDGAVAHPPAGVTHLVRRTRLLTDRRLLPGAVAVLDVETGTVRGKRVTIDSVAVYQVRGNVLSGVYGEGPAVSVAEARTLRAAERSAANLRRYVRASSAPTS